MGGMIDVADIHLWYMVEHPEIGAVGRAEIRIQDWDQTECVLFECDLAEARAIIKTRDELYELRRVLAVARDV